jgi:pimeloyl-ACP methyl ester carboxylesterase
MIFRRCWLILLIAIVGCATKPLPVTTPIDQLYFQSGAKPSQNLIVLLPGIGDEPEAFLDEGFIQAVRERHIDADLVAVRAHWGYYEKHVVVDRLHQDVIVPARAKGYRHIWLVGISLGGWGALQYVRQHTSEVEGMLLLAPFLGEKKIFDEVIEAGGLDAWRPELNDPWDDQRLVIAWLRDFKQKESSLKFHLSYGANDRFAKPLGWYAPRLPSQQIDVIPGGHDWRTWRRLWQRFLDAGNPFAN